MAGVLLLGVLSLVSTLVALSYTAPRRPADHPYSAAAGKVSSAAAKLELAVLAKSLLRITDATDATRDSSTFKGAADGENSTAHNVRRSKAVAKRSPRSKAQRPSAAARKPSAARGGGGYLLVVHLTEQLESAMYELMQLAYLASQWQLQLVEPLIHRSFFSLYSGARNPLAFSSLFNLTDVNAVLSRRYETDYPLIVSFESFAAQPRGSATLIHFIKAEYSSTEASCTADLHGGEFAAKVINARLAMSAQPGVNITKALCIDTRASAASHPLQFTRLLATRVPTFKRQHANRVLVVDTWNGIRVEKTKFFYYDPSFATSRLPEVHSFPHSWLVQSAAQAFLARQGLARPYHAVHIRLERLLREQPHKPGIVKECVRQALAVVAEAARQHPVVVGRDYGRLGSNTCQKVKCAEAARKLQLDRQLVASGARIIEYDGQDSQFEDADALSSVVEQEVLAGGDWLTTIGWGSFQRGLRDRFLGTQRSESHYRALCTEV